MHPDRPSKEVQVPKSKLTKSVADAAVRRSTTFEIWDTIIPGFFLKVTPAGRKTFMLA